MEKNIETVSSVSKSDRHEEFSWSMLGWEVCVKIAVIGGLLYLFFFEEITGIVSQWSDPSWSHGYLIPFFSLYFLNQQKKEILTLETKPNYLGLFFLICCLIFYPLNIFQFQIAYFQRLTVIAALGSVVLFLGGWKLVRYTWLPVLYLIFAVPLPSRYYFSLTLPLRKLATQAAAGTLNLVSGLEATARGNVIDVIYKGAVLDPPLDVAEACSGMRLLMAFVALGVAMAYLHYRPWWQRMVLLLSTVPIAVICNIVRVTITGFIYILWDPKYASGFYHDALGLLMLPLAFGLYGALAWFMSNLLVDDTETSSDDVITRQPDVITRRSDVITRKPDSGGIQSDKDKFEINEKQ